MSDYDVAGEMTPEVRRATRRSSSDSAGAASALPGSAAHLLHLQRTLGNSAVVQAMAPEDEPHPITKVVSGGGSPMEDGVRNKMEGAFGHDFADVRIHQDSAASSSAQSVAATAATVGNHIVFRSGEYSPSTSRGQHLLAHELTHVVQQRQGAVDGTPQGGGIKVSDPSDRFETAAEANASRITAQLSAVGLDESRGADAEPAVQRQEEEETEEEGTEG